MRTLTGHRRAVALPGERALTVEALGERFEGWLPRYMAGEF
jgi:hypothetical protein